MRCPKCGKMLDDMAPQCPVCKTKFTKNDVPAEPINNADGFSHSNPSTHYINQQGHQQIQPQYPTQQPQPQFQPQSYPQQNNTRFCGTCGAPMDANVPFCSRCGTSAAPIAKGGINVGAKLLNMSYSVYALLAANLFLLFTTLFNFAVYSPSAEDYWEKGMRADLKYNFWDASSAVWKSYESYKSELKYYNNLTNFDFKRYWSEPTYNYWRIVVVILMYAVALVGAAFVVRAFIKAYQSINSNQPSSLPILKNLRISSIMAVAQTVLLIILKAMLSDYFDSSKREGVLSFSFWFYIIAIFAIGSLVADIFLIKAHSTSNNGYK